MAVICPFCLRDRFKVAGSKVIPKSGDTTLISDGYDRDSKTKYEAILTTLLNENIVIYGFQVSDRTFGAIRAHDTGPKPVDALTGLVESTGGVIFKLDKAESIATNAKTLNDEVRDNWYT